MPTLTEIVTLNAVLKFQSKLIDFTQAGSNSFEIPNSGIIGILNSVVSGSDYKFKPTSIYLVIKDIDPSAGWVLPTISMPTSLNPENLSNYPINNSTQFFKLSDTIDSLVDLDLVVSVDTAAIGFNSLTGYIIVEGSFINMAL